MKNRAGMAAEASNERHTLIGDEYVDECVESNRPATYRNPVLTRDVLEQMWAYAEETTRPSWQGTPPPKLGEAGHGKLKADQWRSCIEFDVPVSLVQILTAERANAQDSDYCEKLVRSTMYLAMAIRYGVSHKTSKEHVECYMFYMTKYLEILCHDFPEIPLRPNHHMALHLGEFLLRFGPCHSWWMFPFERVIGKLQKVDTSHKIGKVVRHQSRFELTRHNR
jgi:hypothetical protein